MKKIQRVIQIRTLCKKNSRKQSDKRKDKTLLNKRILAEHIINAKNKYQISGIHKNNSQKFGNSYSLISYTMGNSHECGWKQDYFLSWSSCSSSNCSNGSIFFSPLEINHKEIRTKECQLLTNLKLHR